MEPGSTPVPRPRWGVPVFARRSWKPATSTHLRCRLFAASSPRPRAWRCSRGRSAGAIWRSAVRTARTYGYPRLTISLTRTVGSRYSNRRRRLEFIQLGNCGSPLEIDEGCLLLTHGAGLVRNYCIGAALLDRDDPSKVLGRLGKPLLEPSPAIAMAMCPTSSIVAAASCATAHSCCPTGLPTITRRSARSAWTS